MLQVIGDEAQPPPEDVIAELRQDLLDIGDIWKEAGPVRQREMLSGLLPNISALKDAGYFVSAGLHRMKVMFRENGAPGKETMPWTTLMLIVARDARPYAVVERRAVLESFDRM